jgi:hypothetical protein
MVDGSNGGHHGVELASRSINAKVGPRHWGYSCAMLHYEGIDMDEETRQRLIRQILDSLRPPTMKMEVKTDIKTAMTLGETIENHGVSLNSKEFIVIGDSADDPTQCVSVIQVEKHTLRNIINKLIRAYKQIEEQERGNV